MRLWTQKSISFILLGALSVPVAAAPRPDLRLPAGLLITSIKIETHNVFETDAPPEDKFPYRAANAIHIQTRDSVIERELLFAVGEPYNADLVEETERNLRALNFLRHARAQVSVNKEGGVDVIMRTYDSWTLEVVANFKRVGGVTNTKLGLADHNLLGQGKTLSGVYSRDGQSESKAFAWRDPQFLGKKHWVSSLVANTSPGSDNVAYTLERPFYASTARSAWGGAFRYAENDVGTFADDIRLGTVRRREAETGINYGVAVATSTRRNRRVTFGFLIRRADYLPIPGMAPGPIPEREQRGFLQLGGQWADLDFIALRRIQKFTQDEDINLGLGVFPAVEWAPASEAFATSQSQARPSLKVSKGFIWTSQLTLLNFGYRSQYSRGANTNSLASFDAVHYLRGLPFQTLAFHAGLDLGWRFDGGTDLILGESNGLRGYGLNQFQGNRRFLFNIEDRIYVRDQLFRLLDVGAVLFYDSGYAWPRTRSVKLSDLKSSVGFGLRLAPSRSGGNNPVRIDLAYALSDNQSGSRWSLSILAGQAFP